MTRTGGMPRRRLMQEELLPGISGREPPALSQRSKTRSQGDSWDSLVLGRQWLAPLEEAATMTWQGRELVKHLPAKAKAARRVVLQNLITRGQKAAAQVAQTPTG